MKTLTRDLQKINSLFSIKSNSIEEEGFPGLHITMNFRIIRNENYIL